LLNGYSGIERNFPICRFGRISLVTDEFWCDTARGFGKEAAWLADLGTDVGASGSPVFLFPLQTEIDSDGNIEQKTGGCSLVGVVKATFDSPTDPLRKLRALTPIEPVSHLQQIFAMVLAKLKQEGRNPKFRKSSKLNVSNSEDMASD